jgi:hypothetical protein
MGAERPSLDRLKKRYGYEEWRGGQEAGTVRGVRPEDLLPGWQLDHADPLREEGYPPGTRAILVRAGREEALALEVWECASVAAARELLLELLDQFESPLVERAEGPAAVGDVAFAHGAHAVLFARANVVVRLRNAGRRLLPVGEPARELDARLVRQAGER